MQQHAPIHIWMGSRRVKGGSLVSWMSMSSTAKRQSLTMGRCFRT